MAINRFGKVALGGVTQLLTRGDFIAGCAHVAFPIVGTDKYGAHGAARCRAKKATMAWDAASKAAPW